jgi:hypothetical protein
MKIYVCLAIALLCVVLLEGCGKAALPTDQTINPGDRIGDFLITTGGDDASQFTTFDCVQEGLAKETCTVPLQRKINVSWGVSDNSRTGKLNALWLNLTYEMLIDGRPVNLLAFGPVSVYHPTVGTTRRWNVAVAANKPGKITIYHSIVAGGEHADGTVTLVFIAPK